MLLLPCHCPACNAEYGAERRATAALHQDQAVDYLQCPLCTLSYLEAMRMRQDLNVYSQGLIKGTSHVPNRPHRH